MIRSTSSATCGAVLISSEPRTASVVALSERWTSNACGIGSTSGQTFHQAPQIRRPWFVADFVEHRLRDVDPHPALGQRIDVELCRQRRNTVDVERMTVVLHLDHELALVRGDRDLDRAAALALVRVD